LADIDFLDEQVRVLVRVFERRVQRIEVLREEMHRSHEIERALRSADFPGERAVLRRQRELGGDNKENAEDAEKRDRRCPAILHLLPRGFMNASISSTVRGTDDESRRSPDSSTRNESSMRTPMSAYFLTAG